MGVTLKLATSLDGRIATAAGESRWITGEVAREAVHRLRAEHDAVGIGVQTALADDPELTVRLDGFSGRQPSRVVFDSRQQLPPEGKLAATAKDIPTLLVTVEAPSAALSAAGVTVLTVQAGPDGRPDLDAALQALSHHGVEQLLVEGGGRLAASFLKAGVVDRIEWFRAPLVLGAEGRPGIGALAVNDLEAAPRFRRTEVRALGADLWERYERL